MQQDAAYNPNPNAHRDVRIIALFELAKGGVSGSVATALLFFGPQRVHDAIAYIGHWLHFDPQQSAMARLLAAITPDTVHLAAMAIGVYAALRFILFWGLWHVRAWASWFGAIAATLYLPFCSYAILRYPGWPTFAVLSLNIVIVWVLVRDVRKRHAASRIAIAAP